MADRIPLLAFLLLAACEEDTAAAAASPVCRDLCDELVDVCSYEAYPSMDSCLQGCTWEESERADVRAELNCVRGAACDTFLVLECARTYGVQE